MQEMCDSKYQLHMPLVESDLSCAESAAAQFECLGNMFAACAADFSERGIVATLSLLSLSKPALHSYINQGSFRL